MKFNTGIILASSILLTACGGGGGGSGSGTAPANQQPEPTITTLPRFLSSAPAGCQFTVDGDQFELSTFTKALSEVSDLHCDGVAFVDLEEVDQLTGLKVLSLINAGLTQVSELSAITNITELDLSQNELLSLNDIAQLTGLLKLSLSEANLTDIESLATLSNLESLDLSKNAVVTVDALVNLLNLKELNLSDNQLSDSITSLSALTNLVQLQLNNNDDIQCADIVNLENALETSGDSEIILTPAQCASVIALENGTDTSVDNASETTPYDRLVITGNYTVDDLKLIQQGDDLRIELPNAEGSLTLENWFDNNISTIGIFEMQNGDELTFDDLRAELPLYNTLTNQADIFYGTNKVDIIDGAGGDDILYGTDDNDQLSGGSGKDLLRGGYGSDILHGGPGNGDRMIGAGNESRYSEPYIDTYLFNIGDGLDSLFDYALAGYHGSLIFGPGITKDNVTLSRSENNLVFAIDEANKITIENWFNSVLNQIATITFDGEIAQSAVDFVLANFIEYGTDANDIFEDTSVAVHYNGGAGNDTINGGPGNDILFGGEGIDTIKGGDGSDILSGGPWDGDILTGGSYGDIDTYIFNINDGFDTINDQENTEGAHGILTFGPGISEDDITLEISGKDIIFTANGNDKVLVQHWFSPFYETYQIATLTFTDTGSQSALDFVLSREVFGTDGDDNIELRNAQNNRINGGEGSDVIDGSYSNDILYGDNGKDTLNGSNGNDTLNGGGSNGDVLNGGQGLDTYVFNLGDGLDIIWDQEQTDADRGNLTFGPGISEDDVTLEISGGDILFVLNQHDKISVKRWFSTYFDTHQIATLTFGDTESQSALDFVLSREVFGTDGDDNIDLNIELGNGQETKINGGSGNDTIEGDRGNNQLYGGIGEDTINGAGGADTLNGGLSDGDVLTGGDDGSIDTYIFNLGDGFDSINDYEQLTENNGVLRFGPGIYASDVTVEISGLDLVFDVNFENKIRIKNWFSNDKYKLETLEFADSDPQPAIHYVSIRLP